MAFVCGLGLGTPINLCPYLVLIRYRQSLKLTCGLERIHDVAAYSGFR